MLFLITDEGMNNHSPAIRNACFFKQISVHHKSATQDQRTKETTLYNKVNIDIFWLAYMGQERQGALMKGWMTARLFFYCMHVSMYMDKLVSLIWSLQIFFHNLIGHSGQTIYIWMYDTMYTSTLCFLPPKKRRTFWREVRDHFLCKLLVFNINIIFCLY